MNSNQAILNALLKDLQTYGLDTKYAARAHSMLLENIREESNNKGANKKPAQIIASMLKKSDTPERFSKANKCARGYGFLDGYRLFIVNDSLGYDIADHNILNESGSPSGFDIDALMREFWNDSHEFMPIEINTAELKYYIKTYKKTSRHERIKPFIIKTPDGYAGYNPNYLLDMINFTGDSTIYYTKRNAPITTADRNALVLPVNLAGRGETYTDDNYNEWRAAYIDNYTTAAA